MQAACMFFWFKLFDSLVISDTVYDECNLFAIIDKQNALPYIQIREVVACPFMGAFQFADSPR